MHTNNKISDSSRLILNLEENGNLVNKVNGIQNDLNKGRLISTDKKIMYDFHPIQLSMKMNVGLSWKTKLKIGILILIALIYTIVFIRRIVIEEQKLKRISEMIKKMKPIIASLYEMDQKVAKEVQDVANSYDMHMVKRLNT